MRGLIESLRKTLVRVQRSGRAVSCSEWSRGSRRAQKSSVVKVILAYFAIHLQPRNLPRRGVYDIPGVVLGGKRRRWR